MADELLPKGIWGEIVGLGDVSKGETPDDVSVLGATEPAVIQSEGALSLLSKKTAKPLLLPKTPELATQTETDEAVDSELFFRSLSAGRSEDLSRVCGLDQVEAKPLAKASPARAKRRWWEGVPGVDESKTQIVIEDGLRIAKYFSATGEELDFRILGTAKREAA